MMEPRSNASGDDGTPSATGPESYRREKVDPHPPPDHADYLEARANGLRATRERHEQRRRKK